MKVGAVRIEYGYSPVIDDLIYQLRMQVAELKETIAALETQNKELTAAVNELDGQD